MSLHFYLSHPGDQVHPLTLGARPAYIVSGGLVGSRSVDRAWNSRRWRGSRGYPAGHCSTSEILVFDTRWAVICELLQVLTTGCICRNDSCVDSFPFRMLEKNLWILLKTPFSGPSVASLIGAECLLLTEPCDFPSPVLSSPSDIRISPFSIELSWLFDTSIILTGSAWSR